MSILERLRPRRPAIVLPAPMPDPLTRRREELAAQVAELQFDLGGLAYEMAIRDHFRLDVLLTPADQRAPATDSRSADRP